MIECEYNEDTGEKDGIIIKYINYIRYCKY